MCFLEKSAGNRPSEQLVGDGGKRTTDRRQTRYFLSAEFRLTRKIFPTAEAVARMPASEPKPTSQL
jgi:hypothetical protein